MKLEAKLARSQLIKNRSRSIWTLVGIVLSVASICAIFGFVASGNQLLLDYTGEDSTTRALYQTALSGITTLLCFVIVAFTVTVISNAFRVSAVERTTQFGILKSVGTTKTQITKMLLYEALWLSLIGIPIGVALGVLVNFSGIQLANHLIGNITIGEVGFALKFVLAWQAIIGSALLAVATLLFSAWLPARKAAKIPAIDAIRAAGEVNEKSKRARPSVLLKRIFGIEGELAHRSIKRNKRNLRATVISLTLSIVLFITGSSIGMNVAKSAQMVYPNIDADMSVEFFSAYNYAQGDDSDGSGTRDGDAQWFNKLDPGVASELWSRLGKYDGTTVFGAGADTNTYFATITANMLTDQSQQFFPLQYQTNYSINLVVLDDEHYAKLCKKIGVPQGSNILINYLKYVDESRKVNEIVPFKFAYQALELGDMNGNFYDLPLHGEIQGDDIPAEVHYTSNSGGLNVIVPASAAGAGQANAISAKEIIPLNISAYYWFTKTKDKAGFSAYANSFAQDLLNSGISDEMQGNEQLAKETIERQAENAAQEKATARSSKKPYYIEVIDLDVELEKIRNATRLIMLPVIGFVAVLVLIGLTNIISTLSTNMRSRAREFAMLRSVGMSQKSLSRMLSLESVVCSIRALVIGLPIGSVLSYIAYRVVSQAAGFDYDFPWLVLALCVVGVLAIMLIATQFVGWQTKKASIIDSIRTGDNM